MNRADKTWIAARSTRRERLVVTHISVFYYLLCNHVAIDPQHIAVDSTNSELVGKDKGVNAGPKNAFGGKSDESGCIRGSGNNVSIQYGR